MSGTTRPFNPFAETMRVSIPAFLRDDVMTKLGLGPSATEMPEGQQALVDIDWDPTRGAVIITPRVKTNRAELF